MRKAKICLVLAGALIVSGCGKSDTGEGDGAKKQASSYPYEELVAAAGEPELTQAYKDCEDRLSQAPEDTDQQMQRSYLLFMAGRILSQAQPDKAEPAFRAALELAQQLVKDNPNLPKEYDNPLAQICYNGACVLALNNKPVDAKLALQQAVGFGWTDLDHLCADPDLARVRALPGFDADLAAWAELAREKLLEHARAELAQGETFPFDFTVTDINGNPLRLEDLKGKVAIVDVWGTWCPPCREEIPSFIKLQKQYGKRGLQIVGLNYENVDEDEAEKLVQDFVKDAGINYPCALGTQDIQRQIPRFEGFPTTLFIDRSGTVRLKIVGAHPYTFLESLVSLLLDEEPAATSGETPGST